MKLRLAFVMIITGTLIGWASRVVWNPHMAIAQPPLVGGPSLNAGEILTRPVDPLHLPSAPAAGMLADEYTPEERVNIAVYENCNRGVVNISTESSRPVSFLMAVAVEGSGSGSVLDYEGHILTNYHVIEGAKSAKVTLYNGEEYVAEEARVDPKNDIAILQIKAPRESLFPIPLGDSTNLRVGQKIYAIGNPFGLERTMSTGIISSLNRELPSRNDRIIKSIIQIDAALNQGNSGGPLINTRGQLIGMNTAIATSTGDNAGIGFAVPVNTIKRVVPILLRDGKISRPTIGIEQVDVTDKGLLIVKITPNGPADRAGLKGKTFVRQTIRRGFEQLFVDSSSADLIVAVDGARIKSKDDLLSIIENKRSGDQIIVTVVRKGRQENVPLILGPEEAN